MSIAHLPLPSMLSSFSRSHHFASPAHYRVSPSAIHIISEYISFDIDIGKNYNNYTKYQYHSIVLEVHRAINGEIPPSLTDVDADIHNIRIKTRQLEDLAVIKCFLKYLFTPPYLLSPEFDSVRIPLCLRGEDLPLCPLNARTARLFQLTSSSHHSHFHYFKSSALSTTRDLFFPVAPHEPLQDLVSSIFNIYKSYEMLDTKTSPLPPSRIHCLSYPLIVSCYLLQVTLRVSLFVVALFPVMTLFQSGSSKFFWSEYNKYSECNDFTHTCVVLSIIAGCIEMLSCPIRHHRSIMQLHVESLHALQRLWIDHKHAFGAIKGKFQLLKTLFYTKKPYP